MEKTLKHIQFLFDQTVNTFLSVLKILIKSKYTGGTIPKTNSESCIVLGNGPSLGTSLEESFSVISKHPLICVNGFAISKEYVQLKPAHYVMLDPGFWDKNRTDVKRILTVIGSDTTWELNIYIPYAARSFEQLRNLPKINPKIKIHYLNYVVFRGFNSIAHFCFSKNLAMPQCQNVIIAALFVAINAGVKNIYLIGTDQNWHLNLVVNGQNQLCLNDRRFYEDNNLRVLHGETMESFCQSLVKLFAGYRSLQTYAVSKKASIYNASKVSFIDTFTRKKLE